MAEDDIWHGGDLAAARRLFPDAPEPWVDLSTGISPVSYPLPPLPQSLWQRLPGAEDEAALIAAARAAYRVPPDAGIVAAPGTQILIELLPRLVPARTVAVLGPTYGEHERAWRKSGADVRLVSHLDEAADSDVVVLVNPNNPDGRLVQADILSRVAAGRESRGGLLVVDEAFADFEPGTSLLPELPPATVVLRSFGKSYGLAGLRVGFAIAIGDLTQRLRDALGPWAVAGPALAVAARALGDGDWRAARMRESRIAAERLDALLAMVGEIAGGTSLFRLLATPEAARLFDHLGGQGIYVRRFRHDRTLLRFGLPGDESEWDRLTRSLASFLR